MDFLELMKQHVEWTAATFPTATAGGSLYKLLEERKEVEEALIFEAMGRVDKTDVAREYADCIMCLIDSAARAGIPPEMIVHEFAEKIIINKERKWRANKDGTYSHVKNK